MFKQKNMRIVRIFESVSKSENLAKTSIVIASSSETPNANENGKKLGMILKEISKLNSRLPDEVKRRKQANDRPKSDFISLIPSFL